LAANPNLVVIGLTGTPFRADSGRLDEGEGRLFDGICYEIPMRWMLEQGYWCRPVTPRLATRLSTDGVAISKGDYVASQLERVVDVDATTRACVKETLEKAAGRRKWLCFTAGVTHCEHVRDAYRAAGVSAEMLIGSMSKTQQDDVMARYRRGDFRCLVVVAMCTTGVNIPDIDCIIFKRPMRSPVLYTQCLGRGVTVIADIYNLNTAEERLAAITASAKPDCLLLDFGGVVAELGPVDAIEVRKRPSGPATQQEGVEVEASPFKRCPSCGGICAVQARYCLTCGYSFATQDLDRKASDKAVISTDSEPEEYEVFSVKVERHVKKEDKENEQWDLPLKYPLTLRVTYSTIGGSFSEFVCFEHHIYEVGNPKRYAWDKAVAWHKQRVPDLKPPISVKEALTMGYDKVVPKAVIVRKEGKYSRVIGFNWDKIDTPPPVSVDYIPF
jgi:DNA repair protein RadD